MQLGFVLPPLAAAQTLPRLRAAAPAACPYTRTAHGRRCLVRAAAGDEQVPPQPREEKKELRLVETNGDLILATVGLTVGPFLAKYLLQLAGVQDLQAGVWIGFGMAVLLVTWTATYFMRVATKDMTYAKQLRQYEDGVLQKRYEELSEEELQALSDEISPRDNKKQ